MTSLTSWVESLTAHTAVFTDPDSILGYGVKTAYPYGLFCEFGVFFGHSINVCAKLRPENIFHGFDTFTGLPEDGGRPDWPKGRFTTNGQVPTAPDNVRFHVGLFEETIPLFLEQYFGLASFLHIDCDIYSSAQSVLKLMEPRITRGTLIKFDEFWGFKGWETLSEARAMYEFCEWSGRNVECLGTQDEKVLLRVS